MTAATQLKSQNTNTGLHLVFRAEEETWSSMGQAGFAVKRGRACLDCGRVMAFLSDAQLVELRARVATLGVVPPGERE